MREMLRKVNEGVIIGDNIQVTVLEVKENSVRLGISCPRAESPAIHDYHEETVKIELLEHPVEPLETLS